MPSANPEEKRQKSSIFVGFLAATPAYLGPAAAKFESSIAIPLPDKILKFQPDWPPGV